MKTLSTFAKRRIKRTYPFMDGEPFVNQTFRRFEGWRCVPAVSRPTDLDALAATGVEKIQLGVPQGIATSFPDFFLDELIPKPKLPPSLKLAYPSFAALKLALSNEYGKAHSAAKTYDWKFIRPRSRQIIACDEHGARCESYDEPQDWDGTLGDLVRFARDAQEHGASEIYVEGGFDGSDYFDFDPYTPTEEFYGVTAIKIEA